MNKSYPSQNMKRESLQGKKYLQLNKELVANIYKEFLQIKGQETDNPIGKKKKLPSFANSFQHSYSSYKFELL